MSVVMRPAQALRLMHDLSLGLVQDGEPDLSARQLAILLTIYLEPPPHHVRDLARKLGVRTPIIDQAYEVLYHGKSPAAALRELLERDARPEAD